MWYVLLAIETLLHHFDGSLFTPEVPTNEHIFMELCIFRFFNIVCFPGNLCDLDNISLYEIYRY